MRELPQEQSVRDIWKTFPLRTPGFDASRCCGAPTVLVQSMKGGFITQNCSSCGAFASTLTQAQFDQLEIWVACPSCRRRMEPARLPFSNYGFRCRQCEVVIQLASLLPRFSEVA